MFCVLSTAASFKAICAEKGYSFETLSKAKYSTMMASRSPQQFHEYTIE
ncbi:hypothetical protein Esi_0053_0106 [Ectocarpus siliculosus]|uniref:Uncharacterized protein n=1 Tax=Ectocarpus siliculosus TaxID=2880 RepID=D8LPU1_ECTSI|nr:hypothetical protein Esi_0053_0106 [Ectocarpus siliculosus]|eukprot:CBN77396.1 hypothetical protein Esi_0053_0106 [Ectocarpus siliculosus]